MTRFAVLVALMIGCGTPTVDGPIEYTVSGGFAGITRSELRIELDGRASRTTETGTEQTVLDVARLGEVHQAVYDSELWALDAEYVECCDDFLHVVAVQLDGELVTVAATFAVADVPEDFHRLVAELEAIEFP